jgi:hypothetical protein
MIELPLTHLEVFLELYFEAAFEFAGEFIGALTWNGVAGVFDTCTQ